MKRAALSLLLALLTTAPARAAASCESIDLKQGWDSTKAEKFWFTSQGSRIMPYAWFMALEVSDPSSQVLFHLNLERYGYIPPPWPSTLDPGGLPIGFAKDKGKNEDEHIGLTCAACHTGSITIGGKSVIVEGGQALADFWTFFSETVDALNAATNDNAKFDRFVKRLQNPPSDIKQRMQTKLADLQKRRQQNTPKNAFGNGRVDAFGHIFTRVLAQDLDIPENARPPYASETPAPVSYPVLWDTPQHDLVQWNGSAPNVRFASLGALSRNVGEVLGVFADARITPGRKFLPFFSSPRVESSANLTNLIDLENIVASLASPQWPKGCLPLDDAKIARGSEMYATTCAGCHKVLRDGERTDVNRQIKAYLSDLPAVQTDPTMAMNFSDRTARTGVLRGSFNVAKLAELKFEHFGAEAAGRDLLVEVVNQAIRDGKVALTSQNSLVDLKDFDVQRFRRAMEAVGMPRYKARPLNGVWASAPYLHNGSVPTLRALLEPEICVKPGEPAKCRPWEFYVGSRELDDKNVGLKSEKVPGAFRMDTSIKGNWRNGHPWGTAGLSDKDKDALVEYLKTL